MTEVFRGTEPGGDPVRSPEPFPGAMDADCPRAPRWEDRQAARTPPSGRRPVSYQAWDRLLFLHWPCDPEVLGARLPPGLSLDTHEGQAWIGVVPFAMRRVRPRGLPAAPWISDFLELNVRTYVHDAAGVPGVWFFSLDANRWPACLLGRAWFHLPYRVASMRAQWEGAGGGDWVDYRARRRGESLESRFRYRGVGRDRPAAAGTLDFFLLERYRLYAWRAGRGQLYRGAVAHAPYRMREAEVSAWDAGPLRWDGLPVPARPPAHICVARRVEVEVFALESVPLA